MPGSTCVECDAPAVRYWGTMAYCRRHLEIARLDAPQAHQCPRCHVEQPPHVSWRGEPCGACSIFPAGSRAGLPDESPTMTTATDELADLLLEFGVDLGDPASRAEKARAALQAGVCPDQARAVFAHVERTSAAVERIPGVIAAMIRDPDRLQRTAAELERYEASRQARAEAAAADGGGRRRKGDPVHPPRNPVPWIGCGCAECVAARAAGQTDHVRCLF